MLSVSVWVSVVSPLFGVSVSMLQTKKLPTVSVSVSARILVSVHLLFVWIASVWVQTYIKRNYE